MRVGTQFTIAFHSLIMIAHTPDIKVTSEMIAESVGCNAVIIRNVFAKLKEAGLLSIKVGRGGTTLARPPEDITLWDIFTAIEPSKTEEIFKFHPKALENCPVGSRIEGLLIKHLDDVLDSMHARMSSVSVQMVLDELNMQLNEQISEN